MSVKSNDRMPLHPLQTWGKPRKLAIAAEGLRVLAAVFVADALLLLGRPGGPPTLLLLLFVGGTTTLPWSARRLERSAWDELGDVVPGPRPAWWERGSTIAHVVIVTAGFMALAANSGPGAGTVLVAGGMVFGLSGLITLARGRIAHRDPDRVWMVAAPPLVASGVLLLAAAL